MKSVYENSTCQRPEAKRNQCIQTQIMKKKVGISIFRGKTINRTSFSRFSSRIPQ
jgi:hypothetical protein